MGSFERIKSKSTPESRRKVRKNIDIANQIKHILDEKGMSNKELAVLMDKYESEISKWLTGLHNFTQETICKIETVLDADILITDLRAQEKYAIQIEVKELYQTSSYPKAVGIYPYTPESLVFAKNTVEVQKTTLKK